MSKVELRKATGISPNTMIKQYCDEGLALTVFCKICNTLNVDIADIIEYIPTKEEVLNEEKN